jgi:hypothetical protein
MRVVRGYWMGQTGKTEALYHSRCGTIKIPPCSKALSAEHSHRTKFYSPSPAMVMSWYKWKHKSVNNQSIKQISVAEPLVCTSAGWTLLWMSQSSLPELVQTIRCEWANHLYLILFKQFVVDEPIIFTWSCSNMSQSSLPDLVQTIRCGWVNHLYLSLFKQFVVDEPIIFTWACSNNSLWMSHVQIMVPVRPFPPLQWTAIMLFSLAFNHSLTSEQKLTMSLVKVVQTLVSTTKRNSKKKPKKQIPCVNIQNLNKWIPIKSK